jgi:hypothetical protein
VEPSRPPLDLTLPRRRGWPWIALAASVLIHAVLIVVSRVEGRPPEVPHRAEQIIVLPPVAEGPRAVEMPYRAPTEPGAPGHPKVQPRRLPEQTPVIVVPVPVAPPRDSGLVIVPPAPVAPERIGPGFGDGQLWVRPLPLPPQELAQRLQKTNAQLADSVVKATIQKFLDSIAAEPGADRAELPKWSTEIAGRKFGIDEKYLTVAGLKIPAAVLALIPLHGGTNESKAFDRTDQLLADLRSAANRSQTVDDFKKAISEMRKRKQEEHEFQKNQRSAPPPELRSPEPAPAVTRATPPDSTTTREP